MTVTIQSDSPIEDSASSPLDDFAGTLNTWPGPVMEVRRGGTVEMANETGAALAPALLSGEEGALHGLIALAFEAGGCVSDRVEVKIDGNTSWFECAVLPTGEDRALVLARDETYNMNVRQALFESRQRYRDLVVISSDFAWETDSEGVFVFVSPHGAIGYSAADLIGHHPIEFVIDNDVDASELPFATRTPLTQSQIWMRGADSEEACFVCSAVPVVDHEGNWRGARGLCRDVTAQRLRDSALAQAKVREQVVAYIVNQIREQARPEAMLEAAVAMLGRAESASAAVYRWTPGGEYELAATHDDWPSDLAVDAVLPDTGDLSTPYRSSAAGHCTMAAITHYRGVPNGAVVLARPQGAKPWSDDDEAMLSAVVGQLAIALRQIADQRELERLSNTDALTGLMNRRAFNAALDAATIRARRNGTPGALIYVDLDNFKAVNDSLGHETGDAVLCEVAEVLRSRSRAYDLVARMGGDEFVVWLDGVEFPVAQRRADDLAAELGNLNRHSKGDMPRLGASVGLVEFNPHGEEDTRQLVSRADQAMYDTKIRSKEFDDGAVGSAATASALDEKDDMAVQSRIPAGRDSVPT